VYCGFNQLKIAIEIINCSADFLAQTKRLIAIPFMYFICMFLFFLFWLASMISVESMGNIQAYDTNSSHYLPLRKSITWDDRKELGKTVNLMMGFLTFGLIWFTFFLQASNNYVTMVTAATFYFSSTRDTYGSGQIGTGLRWAWVTNFGSIAFGSFIIALIFTIRMLVYYVCKKAEKASGDNGCVKCITCVAQCLLKCLEEIMEYINKAAYAYMSVSGESFCQSALHGLMLQLSNGAQFGFANLLAAMFILLGKVGLTVANCFILYFYITGTAPTIKAGQPGQSGTAVMQTPSPWGPLVIVAFTTFLLVSVFLGMFDESVIALMTCLCADMQVHGGDNKWGPPTLHDVIDTINGLDPDAEDKKYAEEKAKKAKVNDSEANGMN
jgi:choline transporter-like protein 2/4/5